jgi:Putative transposase/Transposase zinc-binding domain
VPHVPLLRPVRPADLRALPRVLAGCPEASPPAYVPRDPSQTVLYRVVADHLETFLASLDADPDARGLPAYVERELYDYLQCGVLAHGFLRLGCDTCKHELLLAFSCKRRGFCPSCAGRRMAQTAAHLVERVIPWVPTRQWVVSVPIPLRYWMASSQDLTAMVHTIIRTTIGQYYVNKAVTRGFERANMQPGSVTFIQRFGSAINLNLHFHCVFLEGVYLDRTEAGLTPRFVTGEPPTDADIAAVITKISHRVMRKLRQLGYLEAGLDATVATDYDPLRDDAPELARTMAASVQQRIAFGERTGKQVRRIGAGFGSEGERPLLSGALCASVHGFSLHANTQVPAHRRDQLERLIRYTARGAVSLERLEQDANGDLVYTFTHPWSDGTTGIRLSPVELLEKLAALVPLPRVHLVRYGGCLASHSHLRGAIIPTPRQQGIDEEATDTGSPRWTWARLLKRVFALDMARCPWCQRGALRIIAAITHGEVIRKILQHLKLSADPPPIAPARVRQEAFAWSSA